MEFLVRSPERLGAWPCGRQGRLRSSRRGARRTTSTAEKRVASIVLMASVANSLFPGSNGHEAESIIRILVFVRGCKMVETRFAAQSITERRPRPSFRHAAGMKFLAESRPCRSIASPSENR